MNSKLCHAEIFPRGYYFRVSELIIGLQPGIFFAGFHSVFSLAERLRKEAGAATPCPPLLINCGNWSALHGAWR